nr:hypothetical protein Itr_chr15CG01980 [Ipomoea trifida]
MIGGGREGFKNTMFDLQRGQLEWDFSQTGQSEPSITTPSPFLYLKTVMDLMRASSKPVFAEFHGCPWIEGS